MASKNTTGPNSDPTNSTRLLVDTAVANMTLLFASEHKRVVDALEMHIKYTQQLNQRESSRIDALRAVDVLAVSIANERAAAQAIVLANQVAASAETLRSLVATTAATAATQQQQVTTQVIERLASLEKGQYENAGRSGTASSLLDRVSSLEGGNHGQKPSASSTSTLLIALLGIIGGGVLIFIIETVLRMVP